MKKQPHIMVVDDDQDTLELVGRILELEGYDVTIAADGNLALALLEECQPDLIILDIMMPEPDGFQVLDLIRQHSNVPVIMLTVEDQVSSLKKALGHGADDYVRKPFSTQVLKARIWAKLRRAELKLLPLLR